MAMADEGAADVELAGTVWRLVEARLFGEDGGELPCPLGPEPMGVAIFGPDRVMAMATDGQVQQPPGAGTRAFAAYTGIYRRDGTKLTTKVDGASSPDMFADQVRRVRFESATRMVVLPVSRLFGQGSGLELVWERVG